jgi:modulator of FtsH protease HflC
VIRGSRKGLVLLAIAGIALLSWALFASFFTVDVTEHALVLRFGAITRVVSEPGLHMKTPIDRVVRLDRRVVVSRPAPAEYLTVDKHNVVVESLATWRISDPVRFLATVQTRADADVRLADILVGEIGAVLGTYPAATLIAPNGNTHRFDELVGSIRNGIAGFTRTAYGIEIVDVALLHITLPEQNRDHVFERMKAERGKMAKELRTAGEYKAKKIVAEADHERTRIDAEAYEQSQRIRAEGDAEAARVYAAAYGRNPSFYKFLRTLQAYEKLLDENTTLFLPADAEVMRVLRPQPIKGAAAPMTAKSKPVEAGALFSLARPGKQGAGSAPASIAPGAGADQR